MLPLLVRVDDLTSGASKQYAFTRSPVRVGRNPLNDIVLDAGFISQWHGLIRFDDNTTEYIDGGSTNGTLANGYRLEKNTPVAVAGNVELRVSSLRFFCWRAAGDDVAAIASKHSFGPVSKSLYDMTGHSAQAAQGAPQNMAAAVQQFPEIMNAVNELKPLYDAYRRAWMNLFTGVQNVLGRAHGPLKATALSIVQKQMPAVAGEAELRRLVEQHSGQLEGEGGMWSGSLRVLQEFAKALVPGLTLSSVADVEKLLVRSATVLETSARAFVELRKGQEQFGTEMAVRTAGEMTPLHRAKDARDVLAYLLDLNAEVTVRIQEMTSAYADVMMHQIALLNGMMEGVRSLLTRLGPPELERELKTRGGFMSKIFKKGALWRLFVERHREYTTEERQLSAAVFGNEFARAYSAVVGEEQKPA